MLSAVRTSFREPFESKTDKPPLAHTWGDKPETVDINVIAASTGRTGSAAALLKARFPAQVEKQLSYWTYNLPAPVPLIPQVETISFQVKTNVPVSIKIGLSPFGFIYHGPGVGASDEWQEVILPNAYQELAKWCEGGDKKAANGWISSIILAVANQGGTNADITVDDIAIAGPAGAREAVEAERFARKIQRTNVAAISLIWDEGYRTLDATLTALDEAGLLGADLACLPEECVDQAPEPIPGPTSLAIAEKARQYEMYVVGNLREADRDKTYVTSFFAIAKARSWGSIENRTSCLMKTTSTW